VAGKHLHSYSQASN